MKYLLLLFFNASLFSSTLTLLKGGLYCEEEKFLNRIQRDLALNSEKDILFKYLQSGNCYITKKDISIKMLKENIYSYKVELYGTPIFIFKYSQVMGLNKKVIMDYPRGGIPFVCNSIEQIKLIYANSIKSKELLDKKMCKNLITSTNINLLGYLTSEYAKVEFSDATYKKNYGLTYDQYVIHSYYVDERIPHVKFLDFIFSPNEESYIKLYQDINSKKTYLKVFINNTSFVNEVDNIELVKYLDDKNILIIENNNKIQKRWNLNIETQVKKITRF